MLSQLPWNVVPPCFKGAPQDMIFGEKSGKLRPQHRRQLWRSSNPLVTQCPRGDWFQHPHGCRHQRMLQALLSNTAVSAWTVCALRIRQLSPGCLPGLTWCQHRVSSRTWHCSGNADKEGSSVFSRDPAFAVLSSVCTWLDPHMGDRGGTGPIAPASFD